MRPETSPGARDGFSLIEVLIALSLSVLLISAVYAAIDMYWRFESVGRGEMHRSQLLRAIVQRMNEDFGSIAFQPPKPSTSTSEEGAAAELEGTSETESLLTIGGLAEQTSAISFGVVGTSDLLNLTVSRPARDLAYSSVFTEGASSPRMCDLIAMTYGMADSVDGEGVWVVNANPDSKRPQVGFGRRSVDLYAMEMVDEFLSPRHVIVPEIVQVQFRYYDGVAWSDSWDSRSVGALPRAIEVTFGFWNEPPKRRRRAGISQTEVGSISPLRHVFLLPLSTPLDGTSASDF